MRPAQSRLAFTLVENLIAVATAGVLLALVLSAVFKARSAAGRLHCQHNLRQIGLALHEYQLTHNAFPPTFSTSSERYLSWMARILPYMEQGDLWQQAEEAYQQTDWPWTSPPHPDSTVVSVFDCPDDPRAQEAVSLQLFNSNPQSEHAGLVTVHVAFTSYLGNAGTNLKTLDGVFSPNAPVRLEDLVDGASNTLLAGERPVGPDQTFGWWYAGPGQSFTGSADVVLGAAELNVVRSDCGAGPYAFGPGRAENTCDLFHYWSFHSGGANFLMADGTTRFVTYEVEPTLLRALATRAGGEIGTLD